MPLMLTQLTWPGARVPYQVAAARRDELQTWIDHFNADVGAAILVPRKAEADYIEVAIGAGNSGQVGKKGGKQDVTGGTEEVMYHELMHVLGFHHEQYHWRFPWDHSDPDPKIGVGWAMRGNVKPRANTWNALLYDKVKGRYGGDFGAQAQLQHMYKKREDIHLTHTDNCDFDSVMMYSEFVRAVDEALAVRGVIAAVAVVNPAQPNMLAPFVMRKSGKVGGRHLSNDDRNAVRTLFDLV